MQNQQVPPVAQTLIREGDFAIKLAPKLGLGSPTDEANAESMLADAGVAPLNGWISDYPVTPEIVGQLSDSITRAANQGNIPLNPNEAKKGLTDLAMELNLALPAGPGNEAAVPSVPSGINNYYSSEGPPVITYYPPPPTYGYLYDWVPYPSVWFGFSFPGFYICHTFTTVVPAPAFAPHHHPRRAIVTNRIIDPGTRSVVRIDPVTRVPGGIVRPETRLRAENGRTFNHINEFRNHNAAAVRPKSGSEPLRNGQLNSPGFSGGATGGSAAGTQGRGVETMRKSGRQGAAPNSARPHVPGFVPNGATANRPSAARPDPSNRANALQRSFNTPHRMGPSRNQAITPAPRSPSRSMTAPVPHHTMPGHTMPGRGLAGRR
jgi:hypothetical protein